MSVTPEEERKRNQRNWAIAAVLLAFVVLVFWVTVAKLGGNVMNRPL
jgi:dipeptide/tripeptide permease